MLAIYTHTRCVNLRPPFFIGIGISIQEPRDSHFDKTRLAALKIRSWLIFNEQDLIVNLKVSTLQADRWKLTALVLMGFAVIAKLCLKQWDAITTFVRVKSGFRLSPKKISNMAVRKETSLNWDEVKYRREVSRSLKSGNRSGGDSTRQPLMLNYICGENSLTDDH